MDTELDQQTGTVPNFPTPSTCDLLEMVEMAFGSCADPWTAGKPMHPLHRNITKILLLRGQIDLGRIFDAAARQNMGNFYAGIRHEDAKLNDLQASVPRLRSSLKDI